MRIEKIQDYVLDNDDEFGTEDIVIVEISGKSGHITLFEMTLQDFMRS